MDNPTVTRRLPTSARSLTAIAVALLAIALAPSAAGAAGLTLGFNTDPPVFDRRPRKTISLWPEAPPTEPGSRG